MCHSQKFLKEPVARYTCIRRNTCSLCKHIVCVDLQVYVVLEVKDHKYIEFQARAYRRPKRVLAKILAMIRIR